MTGDQVETILESDSVDSSESKDTSELHDVTITPEDQSVINTPLPSVNEQSYFENGTKRSWKMAESMKVKMFRGEKDGRDQDPAERFLDEVEFLAKQWSNSSTDQDERSKNNIRLFRQHLHEDGDAYHWWNFVMKANEKQEWATVKVFMGRYNEADNTDDSYGITNEILALGQREEEEIQDYPRAVERFSKRVPEKYRNILAVRVIKGLRDTTKRSQVSFALRTAKDCTVKMAMDTYDQGCVWVSLIYLHRLPRKVRLGTEQIR